MKPATTVNVKHLNLIEINVFIVLNQFDEINYFY